MMHRILLFDTSESTSGRRARKFLNRLVSDNGDWFQRNLTHTICKNPRSKYEFLIPNVLHSRRFRELTNKIANTNIFSDIYNLWGRKWRFKDLISTLRATARWLTPFNTHCVFLKRLTYENMISAKNMTMLFNRLQLLFTKIKHHHKIRYARKCHPDNIDFLFSLTKLRISGATYVRKHDFDENKHTSTP